MSKSRHEQTAQALKDSEASTYMLRSSHVKAVTSFLDGARRDIDAFPERIRTTVAAMMEFERIKYRRDMNRLTSEVEALKLSNEALTDELFDVKEGLRKAISTLKERDKLITKLQTS